MLCVKSKQSMYNYLNIDKVHVGQNYKQYILVALSYIWDCLKCVNYIILPCAE